MVGATTVAIITGATTIMTAMATIAGGIFVASSAAFAVTCAGNSETTIMDIAAIMGIATTGGITGMTDNAATDKMAI